MRNSIRHSLIIAGLLVAQLLNAQQGQVRQGTKHLANHNYVAAAKSFTRAFNMTHEVTEKRVLAASIATAYHKMNRLEEAAQWYADAVGEETNQLDWLIAYADALLRSGRHDEANGIVQKALLLNPSSEEAKNLLSAIEKEVAGKKVMKPDIIEAQLINSPNSDYSAAFFDGRLVFASSRKDETSQKSDGRSSEAYSSLYSAIEQTDGTWDSPSGMLLPDNHNTGVFTFDRFRSRGFWTKCNNRKKRCMIMTADFDANTMSWSNARKASFVNKKNHFGHPFVTSDGKWMYFVSDMPGGYGGKDLYKVSIKPDGSFGIPVNLGQPVNTDQDEIFPSMAGDSLLFFSSRGNSIYGGLDILYSFDRGKGFETVVALNYPFNSFADDFGLVMKTGTVSGVFTSARNTEMGDDLFFFDGYPLRLLIEGEVKQATDDSPMAGVNISVSSNDEFFATSTGSDGSYQISVPEYLRGMIVASKESYFPETKQFDFENETLNNGVLRKDFSLQLLEHPITISGKVTDRETGVAIVNEIVQLTGPAGFSSAVRTNALGIYAFDSLKPDNVYTARVARSGYFAESRLCRIPAVKTFAVFHRATGYDMDFQLIKIQEKIEVVISNIYYDLDKASLRESSKIELSKLASLLHETPQVSIQINAHTDARGSDAYNDRLSKARAQSVVDYLIASGIDQNRLLAKGHGKRKLLIHHARSEEEHQANRRTTFEVMKYEGSASGSTEDNLTPANSTELVYRVQIMVSSTLRNPTAYFEALTKSIRNIRFYVHDQNGLYRYEAGDRFSMESAEALKNQVTAAGFTDCFIVPYLRGNRITVHEARQWKP